MFNSAKAPHHPLFFSLTPSVSLSHYLSLYRVSLCVSLHLLHLLPLLLNFVFVKFICEGVRVCEFCVSVFAWVCFVSVCTFPIVVVITLTGS